MPAGVEERPGAPGGAGGPGRPGGRPTLGATLDRQDRRERPDTPGPGNAGRTGAPDGPEGSGREPSGPPAMACDRHGTAAGAGRFPAPAPAGAPAPAALAAALKAEARRLGFVAVGIARAEPFLDLAGLLRRRQARGMATPWEDPDPARRIDPASLLPGARSLIAVAMAYDPPRPAAARRATGGAPAGSSLRGYVAAAGRARSYQHVMRQRLEALGAWLESRRPGCRWAVQVDTGPLVERAVAERAGVGWIGKNACLIVPGHGSWVFLGELVTDVELPPDAPLADACGECDLCLRACPAGAFLGPRELDPRRCISFLTQKGGLPDEAEREAMGSSLYGCDACQAVCPYNRAAPPGHPALRPADPEEAAAPHLEELLALSRAEFRRRYRPLTGAWRGRKIWQRNALIALGNRRDGRAVPALAGVLARDPRPDLRALAAWALGRIGGPQARAALRGALAGEADPQVRAAVTRALAGLEEGAAGRGGRAGGDQDLLPCRRPGPDRGGNGRRPGLGDGLPPAGRAAPGDEA